MSSSITNESIDESINESINKPTSGYRAFRCKKCRVDFKDKKGLDRHTLTVKDCVGILYTCKRCLAVFDAMLPLRQHQLKEDECIQYVFQNKISLHNRIVSRYNIREMGFRKYIQDLISPVPVLKQVDTNAEKKNGQKESRKYEPLQNTKLIRLVFDSLTNEEFVEVIRFAGIEYPDNKLNLLNALHTYLPHASPEKAQIIRTYYDESHISSF